MRNFYLIPGLLVSFVLLTQSASCENTTDTESKNVEKQNSLEAESSTEPSTRAKFEPSKNSRLAIGEKAPDFRLKDQHGNEQSLKDLLAKNKVAVVFFRSADW